MRCEGECEKKASRKNNNNIYIFRNFSRFFFLCSSLCRGQVDIHEHYSEIATTNKTAEELRARLSFVIDINTAAYHAHPYANTVTTTTKVSVFSMVMRFSAIALNLSALCSHDRRRRKKIYFFFHTAFLFAIRFIHALTSI